MDFTDLIGAMHEWTLQFTPMLRMVWAVTAVLGIVMLIIALVLKKNPATKKSPWIVGGIGLLMAISSGTQLIMSFFRW